MDPDPALYPYPTPDPTPFFIDFKDTKKNFLIFLFFEPAHRHILFSQKNLILF
jgi:hypothetical protein